MDLAASRLEHGIPNAGPNRRTYNEGWWAFCVYCHALFEAREISSLAARVLTLNPELDTEYVLHTYEVLAQLVYGECRTWEAGESRRLEDLKLRKA